MRLRFLSLGLFFSVTLLAHSAFAVCGDTVTEFGEQCDDGNTVAGDGCDGSCQIECDRAASGLINGDFEFPGTAANTRLFVPHEEVPGWTLERNNGAIEFRGDGYDNDDAATGSNFIELNGRGTGQIWQEFSTVPGMVIDWSFQHRSTKTNQIQTVSVSFGVEGALVSQGDFSHDQRTWTTQSGTYVVPQGQYKTRIRIASVAPNGGKGNLLDNIFITFQGFDPFGDCPVFAPAPIHQSTGNGNLKVVSNSLLTCPDVDVDCADARALVDGITRYQNSQYDMQWIDADADSGTFNSSSSSLSLAAGETVVWAGLYWMGGYTDFGRTFITPPLDPAARGTVSFKTPGGNYVDVNGTVADIDGRFYRGYADVTSLVNSGGDYWVANVQASYGKWLFGGWTLVVVTQDATQPERAFAVYDPFIKVEDRERFYFPNFTALYDPSAAIKFATVLYDGDHGAGDIMVFNDNQVMAVGSDPLFPQEMRDIGSSMVREFGANVTSRSPAYPNNFGFDSGVFDLARVPGGSTDLQLEVATSGDVLLTGIFAFQTDIL